MSQEKSEVEKPSLLGMITSPGKQFEQIKERPIIWGAMTIIFIMFMIGSWFNTIGLEFEGLEEGKEGLIRIVKVIGIILVSVIIPLLGTLISSVVHFFVAKIALIDVSFRKLFSMNTYITVISAVGLLYNGVIFAVIGGDPEKGTTSLGALVHVEGPVGFLLNSIEVFAVWSVILIAIGLHKVAGFSKTLAWSVSIIFFAIGVVATISTAMLPA